MKRLKKVRLINWHRFQDETIEFAESVLLSGENGAGKKRPFIIGVVMDLATEEKEPNTAWYLIDNKELKDELFKTGKQIKSISAFRSTNKGIVTFAMTATEAKKMMLNRFGRLEDKFFSLIPKALAFKPIHDIKDFVYS